MKPRRVLVPVPVELALVYDGRTWQLLPAPPRWWLDECEPSMPPGDQAEGAMRGVPARAEQFL